MRLIDADELITIDFDGLKFVPKEFIDNAPTIRAKPALDAIQAFCVRNKLVLITEELYQRLTKRAEGNG